MTHKGETEKGRWGENERSGMVNEERKKEKQGRKQAGGERERDRNRRGNEVERGGIDDAGVLGEQGGKGNEDRGGEKEGNNPCARTDWRTMHTFTDVALPLPAPMSLRYTLN